MKDTNVSELQQFSLLVPDPDETFFEISPNTRCDLSVEFLAENIGHSPSHHRCSYPHSYESENNRVS